MLGHILRLITSALVLMMAVGTSPARQHQGRAWNRLSINQRNINQLNLQQQAAPTSGHFKPPITAAKIRQAVDSGVLFLQSQQQSDGQIGTGGTQGGSTALAALAMLAAGRNPASDKVLSRAIDWLLANDYDYTYYVGIRANVWEYALRKLPDDERFKKKLRQDFSWLMTALKNNGEGWRYTQKSTDWDNSCTQYGVLGVWAAARSGIKVPASFWRKMSAHFSTHQNSDGGWGYMKGSGSTAKMATAGLASMFLVFDMFHGRKAFSRKNPNAFKSGKAAKTLASLQRAMGWLGESSEDKENSYYLYGIERAGVASGRKYFGGEDWFKRGALAALQRQQGNGSIQMGYGPVISTSLVTLFLVYGGAPVAYNKLEYGEGMGWNLNPRDMANLSRHLWTAYERPLNWQTVSIDDPVEEFEAPILFISGYDAAKFDSEAIAKLRSYIRGGGTILAEPSDHSQKFHASMIKLAKAIDPKSETGPLGAEHPVYSVLPYSWGKQPSLWGANDGARTWFFLSNEYYSAEWQLNQTGSNAFAFAMNLLFYATDRRALSGRFASILPEGHQTEARGKIQVARIRYEGDWDVASASWAPLSAYANHVSGISIEAHKPVSFSDTLEGIDLLHITGAKAFKLTDSERDGLKDFVKQGGTVLVDAWGGSASFADSARAELTTVFGELSPLPSDSAVVTGRFEGGADLSRGLRFKLLARKRLRQGGESTQAQHLEAIQIDGRPAVLYSKFDLSAAMGGVDVYDAVGYTPASARQVVTNVVAWLHATR